MFNPSKGPDYKLKIIIFETEKNIIPKTENLGEHIYTMNGKRKFILPTEFDLWREISLFENGMVFKKNKKEKKIFFYEIHSIEPILVNSLFIKDKYFAYTVKLKNNSKLIINSYDFYDLESFIDNICLLFPEKMKTAIMLN